jgi:hypothetical protein
MSRTVSCNLNYFQNDDKGFREFRTTVFEKAKYYMNSSEQDVVRDIMMDNNYKDTKQIKRSDFNAYLNQLNNLYQRADRVSIDATVNQIDNSLSNLSTELESTLTSMETERAKKDKADWKSVVTLKNKATDLKNNIKMLKDQKALLNKESASYKFVTKAEFTDDIVEKDSKSDINKVAMGLFDVSLIALPLFKARKNKKLKVNENTFSAYKSFVDYNDRHAYAKGILNTDSYGRWEANVMDIQILKRQMDAKQVELSKDIFDTVDSVEKFFNSELRPYKELTDAEMDTVDNLGFKFIEHSKENTKSTVNWFGANSKGEAFVLPYYYSASGKSIEIVAYSEDNINAHKSGRQSIGRRVVISKQDLENLKTQTKSVEVIQTSGDNVSIVFNRDVLLSEYLKEVRDKAPVLDKHSDEIITAALVSAIEYRKLFQGTFKSSLLHGVKKNYEYMEDFARRVGDIGMANKYKLMRDKIGDVSHTYVPHSTDRRYFDKEFLREFIAAANMYNTAASGKTDIIKQKINELALAHKLDEQVIRQMFLSLYEDNNFDTTKYDLLLKMLTDAKVTSTNLETDIKKQMEALAKVNGYTLNKATQEFVSTVYSAINSNDGLILWKNTLSRGSASNFIPYQTSLLKSSISYVNGGVSKVYKERMKYQYRMHDYASKKEATKDKLTYGVDYELDNDRMSDFFRKYVSNVTGETYVTSQALLNLINSNESIAYLAKKLVGIATPFANTSDKKMADKQTSSDFSVEELKAFTSQINKTLHTIFLAFSLISPLKNRVGSLISHFGAQGVDIFKPTAKEFRFGADEPINMEQILLESGVDSFIDYINELNDRVGEFPEDRQQSISKLIATLRKDPSMKNTWKLISAISGAGVNVGNIAFEVSERSNRRAAFKTAFSYAVTTLRYDKNSAIAYATGMVSKIDGIYDATGKAMITNGELGSVWFKYMNFGVTQYTWYGQTYMQNEFADLKDFLREASDDESRIDSAKQWLLHSRRPSAVTVRYAMAQMFLVGIEITTALIFSGGLINLTKSFGNETIKALVGLYRLIDNLAVPPDDEEATSKNVNDVIRQVPIGLFYSIILGQMKAGFDQDQFGDRDKYYTYSENRFYEQLANTFTPAGAKPFMYFDPQDVNSITKSIVRQTGVIVNKISKEEQELGDGYFYDTFNSENAYIRMTESLKHSY